MIGLPGRKSLSTLDPKKYFLIVAGVTSAAHTSDAGASIVFCTVTVSLGITDSPCKCWYPRNPREPGMFPPQRGGDLKFELCRPQMPSEFQVRNRAGNF